MTSRATPPMDEDDLIAAEYVLGLLDAEVRHRVEQRAANDGALASLIRFWEERLVGISDDVGEVQPPAHVLASVERRLFASAETQQSPSIWESLAFWRGLAAVAVAALIALASWQFVAFDGSSERAFLATVTGPERTVQLVVLYDGASGELRLNRLQGAPAPERSLELWFIAGNEAPVSLGLLPADPVTTIGLAPDLRSKIDGAVLAVSDEPTGGSPIGAPTGPVLASGTLGPI